MMKLLTSGGLGDAAMSLAKIHAKFSHCIDDIEVTHVRVRDDNLYDPIREFYDTQSIKNKVIKIPSWDWKIENRNNYEHFLGSNWGVDNHGDESSWEIEPFPVIKYSEFKPDSIIINPTSGGKEEISKRFAKSDVESFILDWPEAIIIGKGSDGYDDYPNSLYNKTDMKTLVNLIASSGIVISPEGFVPYFAAMCGCKVYIKNENVEAINKRKHPKWDMTIVDDLTLTESKE